MMPAVQGTAESTPARGCAGINCIRSAEPLHNMTALSPKNYYFGNIL